MALLRTQLRPPSGPSSEHHRVPVMKMIGMSMRSVRIKHPVQATSAIRHAIEHSSAAIGNEGEIKVLRDCYASLTPPEQEVMKLVVSGMLNKRV